MADHPGSPDSGVLEAGPLVHADPGSHHRLPGAGLDLMCMGLPQHQNFLGWGHFCRILSLSLMAFNSVPLHWPPWNDPGCSILGLWALLESYLSLILTRIVAVSGHWEAPPVTQHMQTFSVSC